MDFAGPDGGAVGLYHRGAGFGKEEGLAFSAGVEPREDDRIGTIVNERQGQKMGSAHLDEDAKRVDADATTQISLARTENRSRPEDDIAKTVSISVFFY